jgi:lysophospholipase L1-like esterase
MKSLSVIGLVLLAFLQSARCAETNHNFAKWEKEISAFEASDKTNPPPKGAVLFIGSSTIRLWKTLAQDFPNAKVINRGFGGSEIVDSTHFAERIVFPYEPSRIFFRAGGNDLAAGKSAEQVFEDFKNFVTKVRRRLPGTEILFIGWNPTIARWNQVEKEKALNALVKEYVEQSKGLSYVDTYSLPIGTDGNPRPELFMPDKLHFNAEGYKLLADYVRPFVQK